MDELSASQQLLHLPRLLHCLHYHSESADDAPKVAVPQVLQERAKEHSDHQFHNNCLDPAEDHYQHRIFD
jgi:hypothetical protein